MKKVLFVTMIACSTVVGTINADVSSAVSSVSYYELENVEENKHDKNFTFEKGKCPVHSSYEDMYNDEYSGQLYRQRLTATDVVDGAEIWYCPGEISK